MKISSVESEKSIAGSPLTGFNSCALGVRGMEFEDGVVGVGSLEL